MQQLEDSDPGEETAHSHDDLMFPAEQEIEVADDEQDVGEQGQEDVDLDYVQVVLPLQVVNCHSPYLYVDCNSRVHLGYLLVCELPIDAALGGEIWRRMRTRWMCLT